MIGRPADRGTGTSRRLRPLRLTGLVLRLGLGLLLLTLAAVVHAQTRLRQEAQEGRALSAPVQAAIVLGAGVDGDGRLGYSSRRRVAGAVALWRAGLAERLIFSGGLGRDHPQASAGSLMRDHALALGVPPEALLVEPRAVSTFENIRFSVALARAQGLERLALVSDPWHLPRAGALAAWFGQPDLPLVAVAGFETEWWPIQGVYLLREGLAWWLNLGKVAGWEGLGLLGLNPQERAGLIR